jgi:hypothetical protein
MMLRKFTLFMFIVAAILASGLVLPSFTAKAASQSCDYMTYLSGTYNSGENDGIPGPFNTGDVVIISVSLGSATSGTFRIVGDPAGSITLAGPQSIPGTLTYTVTGALPAGSSGIGVNIDSANGTVNVTAACQGPDSVPGPSVPSGFVQKKVVCDVTVYWQADLASPTSAKLLKGQTWYVNPKTVTGKDKKPWYEVYVASYNTGFVPAACMN